MGHPNRPTPSYDLDGPDLRLTLAFRDIEAVHPDDVPEALWTTFVEAREEYREGQRAGAAYEATRREAYEDSRGRLM